MLLAFLLIPVVQKELDLFRTVVWNSHKIRTQKDTALPDEIPDHIYNFPETDIRPRRVWYDCAYFHFKNRHPCNTVNNS